MLDSPVFLQCIRDFDLGNAIKEYEDFITRYLKSRISAILISQLIFFNYI